jgi:hypothetical protein
VKLRLHGTPAEVAEVADRLTTVFQVVSISEPYPDRGASVLVRVYVEIRLDPPAASTARPGEVAHR